MKGFDVVVGKENENEKASTPPVVAAVSEVIKDTRKRQRVGGVYWIEIIVGYLVAGVVPWIYDQGRNMRVV